MNKFSVFLLSGLVLLTSGFLVSTAQAQVPVCPVGSYPLCQVLPDGSSYCPGNACQSCAALDNLCRSRKTFADCNKIRGCAMVSARNSSCAKVGRCLPAGQDVEIACPDLFKDKNKCCRSGWKLERWQDGSLTCVLENYPYPGNNVCSAPIACLPPPPPPSQKKCCGGEQEVTRLVGGALQTICLAPDPNNPNQGLFWPQVLRCPRKGLPSQCQSSPPPKGEGMCGNGVIEGGEQCDPPETTCSVAQVCDPSSCRCVNTGGFSPFRTREFSASRFANPGNRASPANSFWPSLFSRRGSF